jgi:hypothetical protein
MTFSISALVSARDSQSHIKPDSEAGVLIWVEGLYQGRCGKFHVIIYLSHILHLLFSSIDFHTTEKILELTNCEKSCLCSTCKYFCFESGFKKISNNMSICTMTLESVGKIYPRRSHWMEIPIQHDVYIWVDYSFSSYLNFIPIFWNVLIWLKYDLLNIFMHPFPCTLTYTLWDHCADTGSWIRGKIRIFEGKCWYFEGIYGYLPSGQVINTDLAIIGHGKTNILQQNMW